MPSIAKLYLALTVTLGFALLAGSFLWFRQFPEPAQFLACLSLACIASTMKVRLPGLHGTMSVTFVFILLGIAELSLSETITLGFVATVVQVLWPVKTRPNLIQVLFNASAVSVSTTLVYAAAREIPAGPQRLIALVPAATVFFVMNTGMVSLILAMVSQARLLTVWKRCHLWTLPYYLVGVAIVGVISASDYTVGWRLSLVALPLMYLVYLYYLAYVSSRSSRQEAA
jgi:hypothetical protein